MTYVYGKQKIAFIILPSLSIFGKRLEKIFKHSKQFFFIWWFWRIDTKKKIILYHELGNRIEALDGIFLMKDTMKKKLDFVLMKGIP